jgi:hypothetical protein
MDGKEEDLVEFNQWLLLDRRVSQVGAANIAVAEEPLRYFETARTGHSGKESQGNRLVAMWWCDFYVRDMGSYRLVYDVQNLNRSTPAPS